MALYASMIMPSLLLQKPPGRSQSRDLINHLKRRLSLWSTGDVESLLLEGRSIQARLCQSSRCNPVYSSKLARRFSDLMMVGNISLLSDTECGGVLSLDSLINGHSVKDILLDKHPPAQPPKASSIISDSASPDFHPIIFASISPELIRSVALKVRGSSGFSGLDAADWNHSCTSFCSSSTDLCEALASFGERLAMYLIC